MATPTKAPKATIPFSLPTRDEMDALKKKLSQIAPAKTSPERPLRIRIVESKGSPETVLKIALIALGFLMPIYALICLMCGTLGIPYGFITNGIALGVIGPLVIKHHKRFYRSPEVQTVEGFNNRLSGEFVVLREGLHALMPWWTHVRTINFLKDEIRVDSSVSAKTADLSFSTRDPYECITEWETVIRPIDTEEGIKACFKYRPEIIQTWVRAVINSNIALAGGRNQFTQILTNQSEFATWVALIFGGDDNTSPFEEEIGHRVKSPVIKKILLTDPAARKIAETEPKTQAIANMISDLIEQGVGATDAAEIAERTVNGFEKTTIEFKGIAGVTVFAPGGDMAALARVGEKKGK